MKKIQKKYDERLTKVTNRITALKDEVSEGEATVVELEKRYSLSLIDDDGQAEVIKHNLSVARQTLADQKDQIRLLEEGTHPVLVEAANDAVREYAKERSKDQAKGDKLNAELQKAKASYVNALAKAYSEDQKRLGERNTMRRILKKADEELISELSLDHERNEPFAEISGFFNWSACLVDENEIYVAARKYQ